MIQNNFLKSFVYFFVFIGFVFTVVFILMQFNLLNVKGSIVERNQFFGQVPKTDNSNGCLDVQKNSKVDLCDWVKTREWKVVHDGLIKDKNIILDVSEKTGVSSRMIVASVVPEQIRFFTSNRESFKRYFEPMKLLGSMSKFSLGVSGIKQETAYDIEKYANDPNSLLYPGVGIAPLISYKEGENHDTELYNRLVDEHNHYYSYLYTAIYLKEIEAQWRNAGFEIKDRPDVLVTLFNLGFKASHPKSEPTVAGSTVEVGGNSYSFGLLGTLFYNSDELKDIF